MPPDPVETAFHAVMSDLDYPMLIVTTAAAGERAGCLVGFSSQCSIDPPRLAVWLSERNRTFRVALQAGALVVHFPSAVDQALAELFGGETGDEVDKFTRCRWHPGPEGLPVLSDCRRWVAGRVVDRFDTGDHVAFVLEPFDGAADGPWPGQLRFQSVKDVEAGHEP